VEGTVADASKRCHWVNFFLKYKVLVPMGLIAKRFLDKGLTKSILRHPPNCLLNAYNDGFEDAIRFWTLHYLEASEEAVKDGFSQALLRFKKDMELTIAMNDNVYREFFNLVPLFIAKRVFEINEGRETFRHLLVPNDGGTGGVVALEYYKMYPAVMNMDEISEQGFFVRKVGDGYERVLLNKRGEVVK
jgi:hypothetical protein